MNALTVTVVGLGTLGTQIAIQAAAYGHRFAGFDPGPRGTRTGSGPRFD